MDLRSIITVKAILAEGSFQKAAQRLNYSQSTVTFQVRQLENELSLRLFERIGRRMVITQAGKDILPHMESILRSMQEISAYGKERHEIGGELRVAVAESLLSYKIQPVLKSFVERVPKVKLALCCLNCHDIRDGILSGDLDMGVYYDVGGHPGTLEVLTLCDFEGVIVASPGMPDGLRDFESPGQEKDVSFIINEPRSIYRERMERYLKTRQILFRNTIELWSIEAIKKSVASNLGFSFLPRFAVERELAEGTLMEIPAAMPANTVRSICVHHRNKALSRSMLLFKNMLLDAQTFRTGAVMHPAMYSGEPRLNPETLKDSL